MKIKVEEKADSLWAAETENGGMLATSSTAAGAVTALLQKLNGGSAASPITIGDLVKEAHTLSLEKGWYDTDKPNVPEKLCLVHSEISEALEAFRMSDMELRFDVKGKPEGFGVELADAVIRIADLCGLLGIDLEELIRVKHAYNRTRPYRHGGKVC